MKYLLILLILFAGYYTFTYSIYLWKKEKNKLAAFGSAFIAVVGTVAPIIELWIVL